MSTETHDPVDELQRTRHRVAELERELARRTLADEQLRTSEEKYRTLVESSPYCIKLIDEHGHLLSMNRSGLEMINEHDEQDVIGRHYLRVVCREDLDRVAAILDRALAGEPSEFEFLASVGRYFRSNFVPVRGSDGTVTRLISITQDITDRRRLVDELDHRVKNNLAAVLALCEQTRGSATSLDQFTQKLEGRIRAMARSHEMLAQSHWRGVPLHDAVRLALEAYVAPDEPRMQCVGDDVRLPARTCGPLSLTLHEMTTNAVKYGALAEPDGQIQISSSMDDDASLRLKWREYTQPRARTPLEDGMGLNLVRGFIEHELAGSIDLRLDPNGLVCEIMIPLPELRPAEDYEEAELASRSTVT